MKNDHYHIYHANQWRGPLTLGQVKGLWERCEIGPADLYWQEGFEDSRPVEELAELWEPRPVAAVPAQVAAVVQQPARLGCGTVVAVLVLAVFILTSLGKCFDMGERSGSRHAATANAEWQSPVGRLYPGTKLYRKADHVLVWTVKSYDGEHVEVTGDNGRMSLPKAAVFQFFVVK
jgi:hypothetical protein